MASSRKRLRADLALRLVHFLEPRLAPGSRLLLGLSGGLDSRVLLHLLREACGQLDLGLSALHVNHGISPSADAWAEFCRARCAEAGVPFRTVRVEVPHDSGLGLEAAARLARYRVLLAEDADALVLAHHRDDQAETLLLQLLRGAGVAGLAGMGEDSMQQGRRVLRPLLDIPREALRTHAETLALDWIEDESNGDLAHDRNYLRHAVLPPLARRFPNCGANLARSASHLAEAAALLEQIARTDAEQGVRAGRLDLGHLQGLGSARAVNLLRWWIEDATGVVPSAARLKEIRTQLCQARANATIECRLGDVVLRRYRNMACIDRGQDHPPYRILWHGEDELALPDGGRLQLRRVIGEGLALARIADGLAIGNRGFGRLRPHCGRPSRSLKNLWQEAGVPPWERERAPCIWHGETLVAVAGLGVECAWQAQAGEAGVVLEWSGTA